VHGQNERFANLAKRLERRQRWREVAGSFGLVWDRRSAAVAWNELGRAGNGNGGVSFHADPAAKLKMFRGWRRNGWVQAEILRLGRGVEMLPRCRNLRPRAGSQRRAGRRMGGNFCGELRNRTSFHQRGAYRIADEIMRHRLLAEADFGL